MTGNANVCPEKGNQHREAVCLALIAELSQLRESMLLRAQAMAPALSAVAPKFRGSAHNLAHYLALRAHELRPLQEKLAWVGVSSLGRSETHTLANLDKVLGIFYCLRGQPWLASSAEEPAGRTLCSRLLHESATELLGESPVGRSTRMMVTLPSTAASSILVVQDLVAAGMDIARINCAHDCSDDWRVMAKNVRTAAANAGRAVRILMDLGGPKIRTGELTPRPAVLRMRPQRDEFGRPYRPYRVGIKCTTQVEAVPDVDGCIGVDGKWLAHLEVGSQIDFSDARGAKRHLLVIKVTDRGVVAESLQTAYVTPETSLTIHGAHAKKWASTPACQIDPLPGMLLLRRGDLIRVTAKASNAESHLADDLTDEQSESPQVACTAPEVIQQV